MTAIMSPLAPQFLASVSSLAEARLVAAHGADIIDLKDPASGALGALAADERARIVSALAGRHTLSATIGDRPLAADVIAPAITATAAAGVDIVKIGWFGTQLDSTVLACLAQAAGQGVRLVVVLFAEYGPQLDHLPALAAAGLYGVMLDTMDKQNGALRDKLSDEELAAFVARARHSGLYCGLAGSLKQADIVPLLSLRPDYMGFRGALCRDSQRIATLDKAAVKAVRCAISTNIHAPADSPSVACV